MTKDVYLIPMEVDEESIKAFNIAKSDIKPYKLGTIMKRVIFVPATKEQYEEYMRPIWAEMKRTERSKKCSVMSENGNLIRCNKNCEECQKLKDGAPLSLDKFMDDNDYEFANQSSDVEEAILCFDVLDNLLDKLNKLNPEMAQIMRMLYDGESQRAIAKALGVSQSTAEYKIQKTREASQKIVSREELYK